MSHIHCIHVVRPYISYVYCVHTYITRLHTHTHTYIFETHTRMQCIHSYMHACMHQYTRINAYAHSYIHCIYALHLHNSLHTTIHALHIMKCIQYTLACITNTRHTNIHTQHQNTIRNITSHAYMTSHYITCMHARHHRITAYSITMHHASLRHIATHAHNKCIHRFAPRSIASHFITLHTSHA